MVIKGEYNTYFDKGIWTDGMKAVQLDEDKHIDRFQTIYNVVTK